MIEQLWYTWSKVGIQRTLVGFQVKAASPGLLYQSEEFYQFVRKYAAYRLPDNVGSDTHSAPICLALLDSPRGKLLMRKVWIGKDSYGRAGNFFSHMLLDLPQDFSARDAIRLWNAPFWRNRDVSEDEQSIKLPFVAAEDLAPGAQHFSFKKIQNELPLLITAFLSPGRLEQRVVITGASQQIAMLIWGCLHSLPATLLPPGFTFSTYEYDAQRTQGTIIGMTTGAQLDPESSQPPVVNYSPPVRSYAQNTDLEGAIENFANFATRQLATSVSGQASELEVMVAQAEARNITTVEAFMELFTSSTRPAAPTQIVVPSPVEMEKPADPPTPEPALATEHLLPSPATTRQTSSSNTKDAASFTRPPRPRSLTTTISPRPPILTQASGKVSGDRAKVLLASVVILLVLSFFLGKATGGGTATNIKSSAIRATAVAQALATTTAQQSVAAQATEQAFFPYETKGDQDVIIAYAFLQEGNVISSSSKPKIKDGSTFTITILFRNTGSTTWTDPEYSLVCVPNNDPDCQNAQFQGLRGNSVRPGQMSLFSVQLKAKKPGSGHHITLSVAHNHKSFAASQEVPYAVV